MRCFFRVEYCGTRYSGWQVQPNAPSVQEELERAFATVVRAPCAVVGAGRTDAGVHARAQGAHCDLPDGSDLFRCTRSVNAVLPDDVAIYDLKVVDDAFHARYSARRRRYAYYMALRKMPLWRDRAWLVYHNVDWERVKANAEECLGSHDFTAFCCADTETENRVCSIDSIGVEKNGHIWVLTISADRFVYKMVRSIVGTLVDIGRGRLTGPFGEILESRARTRAGETAPAHGLVLEQVTYNEV